MNEPTHRPARPRPITITVCRGCCCGNPAKHPHTDHHRHHTHLAEAAAEAGVRLHTSRCLGLCSHSNVVRIRAADTSTHWFGKLLHDDDIHHLADWISASAPLPPPAVLADLQIGAQPSTATTTSGP
jgi:predicted metal-binding protein